jgi:hypothetical protein
MLILALGLGLTAVWLVKAGYRHGSHGTQLGSMSQSWVVAYNASQPAWSE